MTILQLPQMITFHVSLHGKPLGNVFVQCSLGMVSKNVYRFNVGPSDSQGNIIICKADMLARSKMEYELAIMDYLPLEVGFSGKISVKIMNKQDVCEAINAYETYKTEYLYQEQYKQGLIDSIGIIEAINIDEAVLEVDVQPCSITVGRAGSAT